MQLDFFKDPGRKKVPRTTVIRESRSAFDLPGELAGQSIEPTSGDALTAPETPRIFSISELNRAVRDVLEATLGEVWVRGEISNLRKQSSGHYYFSLKDASSQVGCVLFAGNARRIRGLDLRDGMAVQAFGKLSVYEARGQYQLVIERIQPEGVGALQQKFEELKAKLAAEGLFDSARKKPLPRFPQTIAVVTSRTGAAIRDFLHVLHRRMPGIRVLIAPVRVQGRGAALEIADAVQFLNREQGHDYLPPIDVMVVTRGGGSVEDLWEFNEEVLARAIAASEIPVVSAVGHEIDFTICDFVADFRAPTPSAAAEILASDGAALLDSLRAQQTRLERALRSPLQILAARLDGVQRGSWLREPSRMIEQFAQRTDDSAASLGEILEARLTDVQSRLIHAVRILNITRPDRAMAGVHDQLIHSEAAMRNTVNHAITEANQRVARAESLLKALSPNATLERGFTITKDARGLILRSADAVTPGSKLRTQFADGEIESSAHGK